MSTPTARPNWRPSPPAPGKEKTFKLFRLLWHASSRAIIGRRMVYITTNAILPLRLTPQQCPDKERGPEQWRLLEACVGVSPRFDKLSQQLDFAQLSTATT